LGALFIADRDNNTIRELVIATGQVSTVAGTGTYGDGGSNIPATTAALASPSAVAVGPTGLNVYIADTFNNVIRVVNLTTRNITTVAGNGTQGSSGNGGPATSAELFNPSGVVVDSNGNLYISDSQNNVVRKVTGSTQVITTIAGNGTFGYSGDKGPATSAELGVPSGLAVNSAGTTLYIADSSNSAIRAVNLTTGVITTIAGNGTFGVTGNIGLATTATLGSPRSVAVDANGNVYIADPLIGLNPPPAPSGGSIRLVGGGTGTVSVTVEPFASIAPGYTTVFANNVPTGVGHKRSQGIVLQLFDDANATQAALRSNYVLSTPPNRGGKVKHLGIHRITYNAATNVVSIFPKMRLNARQTYRLIILGQPVGPVTLFFNRAGIMSETV
jgi:sugar lactone lactonase YvrE